MIDLKELRLGNYFNANGRAAKLWGITLDHNDEGQTMISYQGISDRLNVYSIEMTLVDVKGIPLTPELLVKCGFVNRPIKNYPLSFEQENGDRDLDWTFRIWWWHDDICIEPFGRDNGHISIEYLHRLQNLYFALTGAELQINL